MDNIKRPKLSVIITSYNHADYIGKLIDSVLEQTFKDFEILIIDDGSTDSTREILEKYKSDPRVRTKYQENKGIVYTRNKGIQETKGEYVCFVDSDDLLLPDRFQEEIDALDSHQDAGLVYSDAYIIDKDGNSQGRYAKIFKPYFKNITENAFLKYCFFPAITVMFRRSLFLKTGLLEEPAMHCEYFKWIEISLLSKVYYINKPLSCWRCHGENISRSKDFENLYLTTINGLKDLLSRNEDLKRFIGDKYHKRFSRNYFLIGFNFILRNSDKEKALYYFKKANNESFSLKNTVALLMCKIFPVCFIEHVFNIIAWCVYERHSKCLKIS